MNQRFLVTGGSGFIGSALVRQIVAEGGEVVNLDLGTYAAVPGALSGVDEDPRYALVQGSIVDSVLVRSVLDDFEPTHVVNLAAETHVDRSIDGPAPFFETNLRGVLTMVEEVSSYWRRSRRDIRFIHVSTDEVFGPIAIGEAGIETRYNPSSPYAATKAGSDHLVRAWHTTYGLPAIVTNCSNNYGPFQFPEKLIPLAIVRALTNQTIPIYGDGGQVRDWIHVDDHSRGILAVCDLGKPGSTYLIGARARMTNLEVVSMVCDELDRVEPREDGLSHRDSIEYVEDRPGHDRRYAIDPTSIEDLGFTPEMSFREGLSATVGWYVDHREWWSKILEERYDTTRLGSIE